MTPRNERYAWIPKLSDEALAEELRHRDESPHRPNGWFCDECHETFKQLLAEQRRRVA